MSTLAANRTSTSPLGRTLGVGLVAGLVAGVANAIFFFISRALFSLPYLVPMGGPTSPATDLPVFAVIAASTVPALGAALLYWALGRFTSRATTIFTVVAVVFGLLSLGGPVSLPIDLGTRIALSVMHLIAGVIITLGLTRFAPQAS